MATRYGSAQRVPPGLWAKAGYDDRGDWHILMSESEENIRNSRSVGHDHYWRRNGIWHVQIRSTPGTAPSDDKGHLLDDNTVFELCPRENLDNLFRQLVEG